MSNPFKRLSIIVPAYNEERTIAEVLAELVRLELPGGLSKEVVVVNDSSRDGTSARVRSFLMSWPDAPVVLVEQPQNQGKGAAIHRGFVEASGDLVIVQDADLELDPRDIARLLMPVLDGTADVVYGDRFARGMPYHGFPLSSYLANRFLSWLSNRFTGLELGDMEVCYKLMPLPVARQLALREKRFGFEPEVTAALARVKGLRWAQVPVSYRARTAAEGKKIGWKDGLRAVYCIVRYGFSR
jgi:glycosyltransferase involved in cell wall biosynthesis